MDFCTRFSAFLLLWVRGIHTDIRSSITHRWTFNEPFPYKDHVTGQETTLIPRTAQPLKNIDYLNLVGQSCLILGSFTDSCLKNMPGCNSGYSLAFWIKITSNTTLPQIFLGTSRNNFSDLQGIFVYQTETIRTERRVIVEFLFDGRSWQVPLKIQQEIWDFIVATWNNTNGRLAAYLNGELVNTSVAGNESDVSKHVKLRGNFPEQVPRVSLYLESGALYDQVKTWNRSLTDYEVKRAFELQMNDLSKIKCTATRTTLNITWQAIERNVFKNGSQGYRLTVWRIPNETKIINKDLNHSSNHYFLKKLVPYSSYKVRLWDSNIRKRLGGLICGVPSKVRNLTITSQNSTSLSVKWSPPAHKNGILQGYILSMMGERYRFSVTVKGAEKYLATHLMVDTEYEITVQGFTPSGCGAPSRKIAKTNKVPVVRETPKNITAFAVSWHTIEVTWASLDPKEEVTSYEVEYCSFINCSTLQVQDNSAVVKGLTQYTSYNISVRGRNAQNTGPWNSTSVKTLDLDECSDRHRCVDELASCINTAGSYECRCKSGLTGNGYRCQVAPTGSPDDDFCKEELFRNITWMRTPKGKTIKRHCPYGSSGKAFRTCSAEDKASWQKPDLTQCISTRFEKLRFKMKSGKKDPVSLADELSKITKPADNELVVSGDLYAAVDMLKTLDRKTTKNVTISKEEVDSFMKNVVKVADNLLGGKAMEAWQDSPTKSRSDEASKLLTSIENIALMAASVSNSKNTSNVTTSNVVLRFRSFGKGDSIPKRVTFSTVDDGPGSRIEMPASELPRESNITDLGRINHIAFIYLKNIAQLLTTSSANVSGEEIESDTIVNTGVISLSTNPKITWTFEEPVVITLQYNQSEERLQQWCVFWKISGNGGLWSREGCNVNFINSTHTVCHCYHLTSFSVLMQYTPVPDVIMATHELALSLITYIGISISLVALVLALITFCSFAFLRSNRNFAHANLVLSLILAELLFVVGIDKTQYETACFVIAVFLHYLFLVAFCWMATEGIILYLMLVKVLPTSGEGPKKKHFFICSWGIPTVPVVTAILVNREGYTTERHCWLSVEDDFIWSFVGPVLLICLVNLGFLGMTFKAMVARSTQQPSRSPPQMRYWVKACAVLTCLLGTTWLLGLFFVGRASGVMAYMFNIFNVLQGLFIFIFHCLADERIRTEYKRIIFCHGSRRDYIRKATIARTRHNKSSTTITTRIVEKKLRESEEKRFSLGDDTVTVEARSSPRVSRVQFAEQGPIEGLDFNLDIPSLSEADEQNEEECSKTCREDNNVSESDEEESKYHDDESINSDDVFFEDISSSLINIRKEKVNGTREIPSLSEAGEQSEDDCSKTCREDNNVRERDEEESEYHDAESINSDDVFFEDISSSLINIRKGKVNATRDSASKQVSTISNPFENTLICTSDLDFTSYFMKSQRELSHDNEQNEMKNLSYQCCHGSWRVVNVTNHDSLLEIKEVEDENEPLECSADFHLESNYQRQYTSTTQGVYRYSQDSRVVTSTRPAQIAVSESSVISSDFRMSISTFENGNSELEDDSGSVFEEEEELISNK